MMHLVNVQTAINCDAAFMRYHSSLKQNLQMATCHNTIQNTVKLWGTHRSLVQMVIQRHSVCF